MCNGENDSLFHLHLLIKMQWSRQQKIEMGQIWKIREINPRKKSRNRTTAFENSYLKLKKPRNNLFLPVFLNLKKNLN